MSPVDAAANRRGRILRTIGALLFPALWIGIKYGLSISDRFLPGPIEVFDAALQLQPSILVHLGTTALRLAVGLICGVVTGICLGAALYANETMRSLAKPALTSMQNVPPLAVVPFFILWFGFSEVGKFLIVFLAVAVNLAMYGLGALNGLEARYVTMIKSYRYEGRRALTQFYIPYIVSVCLPTLRYMLSVSIGLVLFSELLGAQTGLGYLIQNARSTFSMALVFLVAGLSAVLYLLFDTALIRFWRHRFPWSIS